MIKFIVILVIIFLNLVISFSNDIKAYSAPVLSGNKNSYSPSSTSTVHYPKSSSVSIKSNSKIKSGEKITYPYNDFSYYGFSYGDNHSCSSWGKNTRNKVINNWTFSTNNSLKAIVKFTITQGGKTGSIKFLSTSGNSNFDESVIRAIKNSEPFETMPVKCAYDSLTIEFYK